MKCEKIKSCKYSDKESVTCMKDGGYGCGMLAILSYLIVSCASASQALPIIDGKTVYVNDYDAYMSAFPHTLSSSGYVNFELYSKVYNGNVDLIFGVDSQTFKPRFAQYWNPDLRDDWNDYTCDCIDCWANRTLNYFQCWVNKTSYNPKNNRSEGVESILIFQHGYSKSIGQTFSWNEPKMIGWKDVIPDSSIIYDFGGMDKWYIFKDVGITSNKEYNFRAYFDVPVGMPKRSGKYWYCVKPSNERLQDSIVNGHLYCIDPWWNTSFDGSVNITITNPINLARANEPIRVKLTNLNLSQNDCNAELRIVNSTSEEIPVSIILSEYDVGVASNDSCTIDFIVDNLGASAVAEYDAYYGCSSCSNPSYSTDLTVSGWSMANTGLKVLVGDSLENTTFYVNNGGFQRLTATKAAGGNGNEDGFGFRNYMNSGFQCWATSGSLNLNNDSVRATVSRFDSVATYCPGGFWENFTVYQHSPFVRVDFWADQNTAYGSGVYTQHDRFKAKTTDAGASAATYIYTAAYNAASGAALTYGAHTSGDIDIVVGYTGAQPVTVGIFRGTMNLNAGYYVANPTATNTELTQEPILNGAAQDVYGTYWLVIINENSVTNMRKYYNYTRNPMTYTLATMTKPAGNVSCAPPTAGNNWSPKFSENCTFPNYNVKIANLTFDCDNNGNIRIVNSNITYYKRFSTNPNGKICKLSILAQSRMIGGIP